MNAQPQKFHKHMVHPAHAKGTVTEVRGTDPTSGRSYVDYQGTPDRFPDVDVYSPDEEEQYRAKGYHAFGETPPGAAGHQEYPLMLTHVKCEAATPTFAAKLNSAGQVIEPEIPGRPAKFPPLTVNSEDEEKAAIAKGYARPGKSDPAAVQASISSPYDPGRVTSEYPKMVNGKLVQDPAYDPSGRQEYPKWVGGENGKIVNSRAEEEAITGKKSAPVVLSKRETALKRKAELEAELAALEDDGAEPVVGEDDAPAVVETKPQAAATDRKQLFAELEKRGITYSKNTPTKRLLDLLSQQAA